MNYHVELGSKSDGTPVDKSLNRLRAAAGLIPIIESGLAKSQTSHERAALMCEFCAWTITATSPSSTLEQQLYLAVSNGLTRIKEAL